MRQYLFHLNNSSSFGPVSIPPIPLKFVSDGLRLILTMFFLSFLLIILKLHFYLLHVYCYYCPPFSSKARHCGRNDSLVWKSEFVVSSTVTSKFNQNVTFDANVNGLTTKVFEGAGARVSIINAQCSQ